MKKVFSTVLMAAMICGFVACGNSKTPVTEPGESDVIETQQVADTVAVDTSDVVTRGGTESEGFGRCFESGCHCKAFKGRGDTCGNCGHAYRRHY